MEKLAALAVFGAVFAVMPASAQDAPAPNLEFVFEETVTLSPAIDVGKTARGIRRIIPITGGHFEGPEIKGEVTPGGWDWQLDRPDGCTEVAADYFLKTDDGAIINVRNTGSICRPEGGGFPVVRTHPVFEPPLGKYEWLGRQAFVGTLALAPGEPGAGVVIRIYRVK